MALMDLLPYLKRAGFLPKKVEDFGDGGAFPEINIPQYPLGMGREKGKNPSSKILPLTVDAHGNLAYDAIVKQNENAKKIVYTKYKDLIPKILKNEEEKEIEETMQETKAALNPKTVSSDSKYYKFNSAAKERIIMMVENSEDPLEPPKFKHKKVPKNSGSPPVPVMHSPPRPVTVKDQQDWKIPPCVSNWKNPKGYSIPLDKRLAINGRGLEVQINDDFAKFCEALYVAEQKAREAVALRLKEQKAIMMKNKEMNELKLRDLAAKARSERRIMGADVVVPMEREKLREARRRERSLEAKEACMGNCKKRKFTREKDRDISEKMALGMACTGGEVMKYDQRLFNQEKGMDSGFAIDDQYNIYDKGLFIAQPTLSTLYRPKKDMDSDMYGSAEEQLDHRLMKTDRFKPDKASGPRDRPVEFEKEADPFGLDQFLTVVKKCKN
ncbi:hypothetical protein CCACVL1_11815 [Corchorus capsularis]|uniref:SKI-interacting protein SKIP SNW domain-containing protein n=1 Tax=Corchorus capsularis TaxID=210143 RepID=A0A1R3IJB0_COCAP|nr:hypothetical protein CCACVL1_11815 [Corchorus capsularis]